MKHRSAFGCSKLLGYYLHILPIPLSLPKVLLVLMEIRGDIKQAEAERSRVSRRASSSWEEDTEMKTLEYVKFFNGCIKDFNILPPMCVTYYVLISACVRGSYI